MSTARLRTLLLPILAALAAVAPAAAQPPAAEPPDSRLTFPEGRSASYGEVYQHDVVRHRFVFENRSEVPVEILGTTAKLATGRVEVEPRTVPPGGRGEVRIEQPVGDRLGTVTFRFGLRTDDPALPEPKLTLGGFVQSAYEPEVGRIDLGLIDRSEGGSARIELASRETGRLGPVTLADGPPWLSVTPRGEADGGQRLDLEIAVAPGAPPGYHFQRVLLKTAVPRQPDYVLEVRAAVYGDVVPSEAPIDLGLLREGHRFEKQITLRSRSGAPVEIVALDPGGLRVELSPCPGTATLDCRLLTLSGTPEAQGSLDGKIQVQVAGHPDPIPLTYSAIVASRNAVVRDLGPLVEGTVVSSDGTILRPDTAPEPNSATEPSQPETELGEREDPTPSTDRPSAPSAEVPEPSTAPSADRPSSPEARSAEFPEPSTAPSADRPSARATPPAEPTPPPPSSGGGKGGSAASLPGAPDPAPASATQKATPDPRGGRRGEGRPTPDHSQPSPSPGREAADPPEGGRSAPASPETAAPLRPDGPPATATAPEVTLTWTVRQQQRAYGFLVYRSDNREGPFVRVTPEILRTRDEGDTPSRYRWTDRDVEPGKTYYYYLDTVARSGLKQRLTAVQSKTVPAAPAAPNP